MPAAAQTPAPTLSPAPTPSTAPTPSGPISLEQLRNAWPEVLSALESRRLAWLAVERAQIRAFDGEVLGLAFATQGEVIAFREHSEALRGAIQQVLGIRVKFTAKALGGETATVPVGGGVSAPSAPATPPPAAAPPAPSASSGASTAPAAAAPVDDWVVAPIPRGAATAEPTSPATASPRTASAPSASAPAPAPDPAASMSQPSQSDQGQPVRATGDAASAPRSKFSTGGPGPKYGEAVVRELLGAKFLEEEILSEPIVERVAPVDGEYPPDVPSDFGDPGPQASGFDFADEDRT